MPASTRVPQPRDVTGPHADRGAFSNGKHSRRSRYEPFVFLPQLLPRGQGLLPFDLQMAYH
jgi:hypothetical protein